ncbi:MULTISPECIES: phosphoadenylyl-sulfate reductase [Flavobacterium]|uniref:Adenosine 5'-phosphosulfate reductase n=1 Tax=Flavobacterium columnare TaxID=996 RepID=A0AA94JNL3_9FLAO|nr:MULTISPECIES: phosphoadenylyl-sulfate reductase [Flavobacterium]AMA50058.1 phosphoadenosine phosphosulfate reductase [Flavobacterium covae]MCH4829260.1 phosphoadenylyl-sulfate reductase [Flavobacterium columnare]MCH4834036.1 phosphoadenylyl-sulfate reductase [Flavobacterium columnare]MCJ1808625.1 phosphoadenylyl-sulfate reductase [Flavobacterium covae]QYS91541.1 phosphoadenylyl-sulfate reductase [Flavobacterium covae]
MTEQIKNFLNYSNNLTESLRFLSENFTGKIVFSTSFGIEDQVITNEIFTNKLNNIEVFTLDTGRLFAETYSVWDKTTLQYGNQIKAYYPQASKLEKYVNQNGINGFYASVENRKECCHIRKVEPLNRALEGANLWITGLRAEQSQNRQNVQLLEWDQNFKLYKYNPLLNWTLEEVVSYLKLNGVPYNTLHDKGYVSIGCAPCTRAIKEGEDFRAGRWWWEDQSKKECGLHR